MEEKLYPIWHRFVEGSLPPEDVDVIAYNKKWIDADNNPRGIRIGFRVEDRFYSAQWNGDANYNTHCSDDNDYYDHNGKDELPEYWIEIPKLTLFKVPKDHKEFEPFQKVLVKELVGRNCEKSVWMATEYSHYDKDLKQHYCIQCYGFDDDEIIPYEGNEDKLGKTVEL